MDSLETAFKGTNLELEDLQLLAKFVHGQNRKKEKFYHKK